MNTKNKTSAPVPPKPKKMSFLGALSEKPTFTADNMPTVSLKDLNFKVDPEFHRRFKATASARGLSMKELLEQSFEAWEAKNR